MGKVIHKIIKHDDSEYIFREFKGVISIEEIMDSFVYMLNENMIGHNCSGILTDLRDAEIDFNMNTFKKLLIYIKSNPRLIGLKIAVVVDSAEKIVFPMIASNEPGLLIQPFSTIELATRWITQ